MSSRGKFTLLAAIGLLAMALAGLFLNKEGSDSPDPVAKKETKVVGQSTKKSIVEPQEVAFEESDPLHKEIIAKAEALGVSEEQLQSIKSNVGKLAQMVRVFSYPIELYGKVVDTDGNPVAGAKVKQAFTGEGCDCPEYLLTDENGEFYLSGKGSSIYIRVTKEGYYETEKSKGSVGYTVPSVRPPAGDPRNPAIFVLRKQGEAEPLVKFGERWGGPFWSIPRNGNASGFNLLKGRNTSPNDAHIVVRAWSPEEKRGPNNELIPYAWKFEITAPGGGFIERTDQFDFTAPESGYTETLSFEMSADAERWNDWHEREVFAKLKDGNYARLLFRYRPSNNQRGDSFTIESYTNPSGSRNLEYDPSLEIADQ